MFETVVTWFKLCKRNKKENMLHFSMLKYATDGEKLLLYPWSIYAKMGFCQMRYI